MCERTHFPTFTNVNKLCLHIPSLFKFQSTCLKRDCRCWSGGDVSAASHRRSPPRSGQRLGEIVMLFEVLSASPATSTAHTPRDAVAPAPTAPTRSRPMCDLFQQSTGQLMHSSCIYMTLPCNCLQCLLLLCLALLALCVV